MSNERQTLLNNMEELLDEYDYFYTTDALESILDTWEDNKTSLLNAFKNHPNYIEGKYCIAFDSDYNREIDIQASKNFSNYLYELIINDLFTIPDALAQLWKAGNSDYYWGMDMYHGLCYPLYTFLISHLDLHAHRTLSEEGWDFLNAVVPDIHPHAGEKTSRVINRLCTYLGFSKDANYNKEFAKYADSLSPMTIKRHTILSLNPLDYLTMSFGNSWASCHTIDKDNKRGMPNSYSGAYSSGTISYMLDESSLIFYTVDSAYDGDNYWSQPKINRQMFHYSEGKLVQGRLYPQGNDGNTDEYTIYRNIVQQVIAQCFNIPNLWTLSKGTENASKYIISEGTHYQDYRHFDNCTLSYNKEAATDNSFVVGHDPICIECGDEHDVENNINHCHNTVCWDCGCECDEDELEYIDGHYYCHDCCNYCDCCETYHRSEEYYINNRSMYVCESCYEEYYTRCEHCEDDFDNDDIYEVYDEYGDVVYVCEDCRGRYYKKCAECGNYHYRDPMTTNIYDNYVCPECLENKYAQCKECGEWYPKEELTLLEDDTYICDDCYKEELTDAV